MLFFHGDSLGTILKNVECPAIQIYRGGEGIRRTVRRAWRQAVNSRRDPDADLSFQLVNELLEFGRIVPFSESLSQDFDVEPTRSLGLRAILGVLPNGKIGLDAPPSRPLEWIRHRNGRTAIGGADKRPIDGQPRRGNGCIKEGSALSQRGKR